MTIETLLPTANGKVEITESCRDISRPSSSKLAITLRCVYIRVSCISISSHILFIMLQLRLQVENHAEKNTSYGNTV